MQRADALLPADDLRSLQGLTFQARQGMKEEAKEVAALLERQLGRTQRLKEGLYPLPFFWAAFVASGSGAAVEVPAR